MEIDEQWECWTLSAIKMKLRTGGKGLHLWPRLVQKIAEGKTYELSWKVKVMKKRRKKRGNGPPNNSRNWIQGVDYWYILSRTHKYTIPGTTNVTSVQNIHARSITQPLKWSMYHSIGRTHNWRILQQFPKKRFSRQRGEGKTTILVLFAPLVPEKSGGVPSWHPACWTSWASQNNV